MDLETEEGAKPRRWQQVLYILAPFFLLLVCLGLINVVPNLFTAVSTATPQPERATTGETAIATNVASTATLSPTPTPVPTATLPPNTVIELLGPPPDSGFRRSDTISFYADWPLPLTESQQLAAYVRFDGQAPILLSILEEPNVGQRYRWQMDVGEIVETAVSLEWWVQLQTDNNAPPLLSSTPRQVTILP
jgi:hypothetical protein